MHSQSLVMPRIKWLADTRYPSGYLRSFWILGPAEQVWDPARARVGWARGLTGFFGSHPKVEWIPGIMVISAATEMGNSWESFEIEVRHIRQPHVAVPADFAGEVIPHCTVGKHKRLLIY